MLVDRRFAVGLMAALAGGASRSEAAEPALDVSAIVEAAAREIRARYVNPNAAERLSRRLLRRLREGAYATTSRAELAHRLTADLRTWTRDLHMEVLYQPPTVEAAEDPGSIPEDEQHPRTTGWGVQTVARLQGNVGLMRITHFPSPPTPRIAPKYGAAMELLADTAAIIIDLTINHGGGADTSAYLLSYFIDGDVELGRVQMRGEPLEIIRTTPDVMGPRFGATRPVYVLISSQTFSAGEAVALHLKTRRGAILVGERTRGGAHMGDFVALPDNFSIFIVMGQGEGPDWEGVGVAPDIEAPPSRALAVAHAHGLEALLAREADPERAQILRNVIADRIENLSSFDFEAPSARL